VKFKKGPWDPYVRIFWTYFLKSAPPELMQKGAVIVLNRHAPPLCMKGGKDEFLAGHALSFISWIVFMVSSP
jgi:hypothetical protein